LAKEGEQEREIQIYTQPRCKQITGKVVSPEEFCKGWQRIKTVSNLIKQLQITATQLLIHSSHFMLLAEWLISSITLLLLHGLECKFDVKDLQLRNLFTLDFRNNPLCI
jgi:hypothetical protein